MIACFLYEFFHKEALIYSLEVLLTLTVTPSRADPEIMKRGGAQCRPSWLVEEEKFRFPDGLKRPK